MDYVTLVARHFAHLVRLLLTDAGSLDAQKAALRALLVASREGAVRLTNVEGHLLANDARVPEEYPGVRELATLLEVNELVDLVVERGAAAGDVLGVARLLARRAAPAAAPETLGEQLAALNVRTVRVQEVAIADFDLVDTERQFSLDAGPPGTPRRRTPATGGATVPNEPRRPTPGRPAAATPEAPAGRTTPTAPAAPVPAPASGSSTPAGASHAGPPPAAPLGGLDGGRATPASALDPARREPQPPLIPFAAFPADGAAPAEPGRASGGVPKITGGYDVIVGGAPGELLNALDETTSPVTAGRLLDALATAAEESIRKQEFGVAIDVLYGLIQRETSAAQHRGLGPSFSTAMRRLLAKRPLLEAVAARLPRREEEYERNLAVLARAGEDGADALVSQIGAAQSIPERRLFFDALRSLKIGIPSLVHMLGDQRWFVVRNALTLLGELRAPQAEGKITALLTHGDARVRRAAAVALARLGTPSATRGVYQALRDASGSVRHTTVTALVRGGSEQAAALVRALDSETELDTQTAIMFALARTATPEAVERLIEAARPDKTGFFRGKKKPPGYRVAAVEALAEARTPESTAAVRSLLHDPDKEVRGAALWASMAERRDRSE